MGAWVKLLQSSSFLRISSRIYVTKGPIPWPPCKGLALTEVKVHSREGASDQTKEGSRDEAGDALGGEDAAGQGKEAHAQSLTIDGLQGSWERLKRSLDHTR